VEVSTRSPRSFKAKNALCLPPNQQDSHHTPDIMDTNHHRDLCRPARVRSLVNLIQSPTARHRYTRVSNTEETLAHHTHPWPRKLPPPVDPITFLRQPLTRRIPHLQGGDHNLTTRRRGRRRVMAHRCLKPVGMNIIKTTRCSCRLVAGHRVSFDFSIGSGGV
jgi:hypothetical protein